MSELKPGDRVAVYWGKRCVGTVEMIRNDGLLQISVENGSTSDTWIAHPKQCRKLVKKERRRVWFEKVDIGQNHWNGYSNEKEIWESLKPGERVEFIEVRKKK